MSNTRQPGYYWVKPTEKDTFVIAYFNGKTWDIDGRLINVIFRGAYQDDYFTFINPDRIPNPDEPPKVYFANEPIKKGDFFTIGPSGEMIPHTPANFDRVKELHNHKLNETYDCQPGEKRSELNADKYFVANPIVGHPYELDEPVERHSVGFYGVSCSKCGCQTFDIVGVQVYECAKCHNKFTGEKIHEGIKVDDEENLTPEQIVAENFRGLDDLISDKEICQFYKDLIVTCIKEYHNPTTD